MFFRVFLGDHLHLHGLQVEASLLKSLDDFVDETTLDAVRLNHDVSAFHVYVCMLVCACVQSGEDNRSAAIQIVLFLAHTTPPILI